MEKNVSELKKWKVPEIELVYKSTVDGEDRPVIKKSTDAYEVFLTNWDQRKLELLVQVNILYLNNGSEVMQMYTAGTGGMSDTVLDVRLIFAAALQVGATRIIVGHNHPGASLKHAAEDGEVAAELKAAGRALKINMLDYMIISKKGYVSFADEGLL